MGIKYALHKVSPKALQKRGGASRQTQKLCHVLERYLEQLPRNVELRVREEFLNMGLGLGMAEAAAPSWEWEVALALWQTILNPTLAYSAWMRARLQNWTSVQSVERAARLRLVTRHIWKLGQIERGQLTNQYDAETHDLIIIRLEAQTS